MKVPSKFYFLTSSGDDGIPNQPPAAQLGNPNIAGFRWRHFHSALQPSSQGSYDWQPIDDALDAFVISGQKMGLSVAWGNTVARWIYDDVGVEEFIFDPIDNEVGSMPNFFDPLYLPVFLNFVQTMGALYDPHPA